jgi:aryl-alcohol dehydrogenase-like predicted oxidoreductase
VQVLREAQQDGTRKYIGISGNTAPNVARVLAALDVDTCLLAFNYDLIWRGARSEVLALAQQKGIALILGAIFFSTVDSPTSGRTGRKERHQIG